VGSGASRQELDKAYRKLQRENHPDFNPNDKGARARWDDAQAAYNAVKNKHKRQ
jgi:molecular chaperone DnaJ